MRILLMMVLSGAVLFGQRDFLTTDEADQIRNIQADAHQRVVLDNCSIPKGISTAAFSTLRASARAL